MNEFKTNHSSKDIYEYYRGFKVKTIEGSMKLGLSAESRTETNDVYR